MQHPETRSRKAWWALLPALGLAAALASPAQADGTATVRFDVSDLDSTDGHVLCGLYKDESKWLTAEFHKGVQAKPRDNGTATCVFENVPPGRYAILAFHDEDDDQSLDRGLMGIPREDYCASNDAYRRFGPPPWGDALFRVGSRPLRLAAPMH